jgi:hypothetical protein
VSVVTGQTPGKGSGCARVGVAIRGAADRFAMVGRSASRVRRGAAILRGVFVSCAFSLPMQAETPGSPPADAGFVVRHIFDDGDGFRRVGVLAGTSEGDAWRLVPDEQWHGPIRGGDARFRWNHVTAVRHHESDDGTRTAYVLDAGPDAAHQRSHPSVGGAKLVALDADTGRARDGWWFDVGHEVDASSHLRDMVVEPSQRFAVIHDAGTAGLLVVDLKTRRTRRALTGAVPGDTQISRDSPGLWLEWATPGADFATRLPWSVLTAVDLPDAVHAHFVETRKVVATEKSWTRRGPRRMPDDPYVRPPSRAWSGGLLGDGPLVDEPRAASRPKLLPGAGAGAVARRWLDVAMDRGVGGDPVGSILRREAARGATRAWRERETAPADGSPPQTAGVSGTTD